MNRYGRLTKWTGAQVSGGEGRPLAAKVVVAIPMMVILLVGYLLITLSLPFKVIGKMLDRSDANQNARARYTENVAVASREARLGLGRTPTQDD